MTAVRAERVVYRFAMEFPTEEARRTYLHEHPKADPKNHTVKKPNAEGHTFEDSAEVASDLSFHWRGKGKDNDAVARLISKLKSRAPIQRSDLESALAEAKGKAEMVEDTVQDLLDEIEEKSTPEHNDKPTESKPAESKSQPAEKPKALGVTDADVEHVRNEHKAFFGKLKGSMKERIAKPPSSKIMPKARWDAMSDGEKFLFVAGHEVGDYFAEHLKNKKIHDKTMYAWRASSGDPKVQELHGLLSSMGVKGSAPAGERDDKAIKSALKKGPDNKQLQAYVKEAIAFNRAVFKDLGVDHVTVYRDVDGQGMESVSKGGKVSLGCREASSFTSDPGVTGQFGKYTVKFKLPVDKVLFSPFTYSSFGSGLREKKITESGAFGESELVVMGASDLVGERVR